MKKILISTSGGDCPGLNAVIRGIVMRAAMEKEEIEIIGSIQAYNGILWEPTELKILDKVSVAGIHYQGGTILETTNKGGPFAWPYFDNKTGEWKTTDRSDEMIRKLQYMNVDAVISIGGDGSQRISQRLY
ncbi:MAG: 6-phosphofructokinase, partial [Rikenellaceae bacterium]